MEKDKLLVGINIGAAVASTMPVNNPVFLAVPIIVSVVDELSKSFGRI